MVAATLAAKHHDTVLAQTSGNDIFFRNPSDVDENLFVSISSPSTSQFTSIEDLGGPEEAAERTLRQYLEELKTTRCATALVS